MLSGEAKKKYQRDYMKRKRSNKQTVAPVRPKNVRPINQMDARTFGYATLDVPEPAWMSQKRRD